MSMADLIATSAWRIRLLAGASAAISSAIAGVVLTPTLVGIVFGAVGIPVGAVLGLCYGPQLLVEYPEESLKATVAALATAMGTAAVGIGFAVSQSRGASLPEISELAFLSTVGLGMVSVPLGYPFAKLVTWGGTQLGHRLIGAAWIIWPVCLAVLLLVSLGTITVASRVVRPAGFFAVQNGEARPLTYVIHAERSEEYRTIALRSFADGEIASFDEAPIVEACTSGAFSVVGARWALWIVDVGLGYDGQLPPGKPLLTSSEWAAVGQVDVTISIRADGTTTWHRGIRVAAAC
jgi:hypothetical protein